MMFTWSVVIPNSSWMGGTPASITEELMEAVMAKMPHWIAMYA